MMNDQSVWPEEHISLNAAAQWVASVCGHAVEPVQILQTKPWGVTARFGGVVIKASFTPLYPQVTAVHAVLESLVPPGAPRLLASRSMNGQLWKLFEFLEGATAEQVGTPAALAASAHELARVQAAVTGLDLQKLPTYDVRWLPGALLEDDLSDQPAQLVQWLCDAQPSLQLDAEALADIPLSLDHPDVNASNAIMLDGRRAILLDWEEATVGCPLFSLDRLLDDAHEIAAVKPVMGAYLDAFGAVGAEQIERAMRLVPLRRACENRAYARALGWPHPHSRLTT
jgi:aminoglycoside phosphotransferase (APT) family kinase protein